MNYVFIVSLINLTLCASLKPGWVTILHRNALYLGTIVRDVTDIGMVWGGGAMSISHRLETHVLLCGPNNLELLVVSVNHVNNPRQKVHIGLWYWPPDNSVALDNLHSTLEDLDISVFSSFILVGDFYNHYHHLFCKLLYILNSFVLTQVVPTPTHTSFSGKATLIDLVLLSSPSQLKECSVIPPLCNSDNDGINLILKWSYSNSSLWRGKVAR